MPTYKKPRSRGTTYKLVPRSYGDAEGEEGPIWVSEAEFYRNHQNPTAVEEEDKAQRQFHMYAAAANAEFNEERRKHSLHAESDGGNDGADEDYEGEGAYYDDEEGEWADGDWEEEEAEAPQHTPAAAPALSKPTAAVVATAATKKTVSFALPGAPMPGDTTTMASTVGSVVPVSSAMRARGLEEKRARDDHVKDDHAQSEDDNETNNHAEDAAGDEEEVDEKLFDDEVECEVTDDFLRQLVFGNGDEGVEGDGADGDFAMNSDEDDDWDGLDQEDREMWRLLTDEEKTAIKASRRRGTARRRKMAGAEEDVTRTHAADGTEYPTHDVTQRALERQFTEMMREFNADARLNDAYTDDPRTHGALPMEKYMAALEEFVTDRAGMDVETAEPHKNKGLIQQLKYLSHQAGAFDSDGRGTYMTTLLSEKQQRFVEEFQKGTEEIRRAARQRLAQRQQTSAAATLITSPAPTTAAGLSSSEAECPVVTPGVAGLPDEREEVDEEEEMIVMEVKSKADRLDCETAVSAYSTYYNQPNVIQAPRKSNPGRRPKKAVGVVKGNVISASSGNTTAEATFSEKASNGASKKKRVVVAAQRSNSSSEKDKGNDKKSEAEEVAMTTDCQGSLDIIPTVRPKGETKEEKRLRRQAVKAAQRERRQAKSALKFMYRDVESEEVKRNAISQAARRTVHFM